ncbi:hypothetical protein SNEBB_006419 [Seison nebaliae]|nr:hypothetical protein SNEBB_006419 [Seison nebaliae]
MDQTSYQSLANRIKQFKPSSYGLPVEEYQNIFDEAFGIFDTSFVQKLKDLEEKWEAREDDVWVVSYPKCGHAWSFDFLSMIMKNSTELEKCGKIFSFLEMSDKVFTRLHEMEGGRLIMTHIPPQFLPHTIKSISKIICIFRSPYDVALSYYYHTKHVNVISIMLPAVMELLDGKYKSDVELDQFIEAYSTGEIAYGRYDDYINASMDMVKEYDGYYFTYENMKENGFEELKKLTKFLHLHRTDKFLKEVVEKTSFESIKSFARERYTKDTKEMFNSKSEVGNNAALLIRKGKVGEGKRELSVKHIKMINENILNNIKDDNLKSFYQ